MLSYILPDDNFSSVTEGWHDLEFLFVTYEGRHATLYFALLDGFGEGLIATGYIPFKPYVSSKSTLSRWVRVLARDPFYEGVFDLDDFRGVEVRGFISKRVANDVTLLRVTDISTGGLDV